MSASNRPRGTTSWEDMWAAGISRGEYFDAGHALPELVRQLSLLTLPRGGQALVPGCGRGYAVEALCASGHYDGVVGLDLSATAVAAANAYLASRELTGKYAVVCGDFFDQGVVQGPFQIVYDYTFFCALPVEWRGMWARRMKDLVAVGGGLVTVMFPMGKKREEGGPPHGVSEADYGELLEGEGGFKSKDGPRKIENDMAHEGRGEGRAWWCLWERVAE